MQRNYFGTTRKQIRLHGTVKSVILDVSASFRTHLQSVPTLESSGQTYLPLQRQLRGYKTLETSKKHQKTIPENLVFHIYRQTNTHLNTAIGQPIAGTFSSECGPASTQQLLKGRTNVHASFRKGIYVLQKTPRTFTRQWDPSSVQ